MSSKKILNKWIDAFNKVDFQEISDLFPCVCILFPEEATRAVLPNMTCSGYVLTVSAAAGIDPLAVVRCAPKQPSYLSSCRMSRLIAMLPMYIF